MFLKIKSDKRLIKSRQHLTLTLVASHCPLESVDKNNTKSLWCEHFTNKPKALSINHAK